MKQLSRVFLVVASALLAQAAPAVEVVGQLSQEDLAGVMRAATQADERWNARDARGLSELYAQKGEILLVDSNVEAHGRASVLDYFTRSFARMPQTLVHRTDVRRLIVLSPTVVLADTWVAVEDRQASGVVKPLRDFYTMTVVEKSGSQWLIRIVRAHVLRSHS